MDVEQLIDMAIDATAMPTRDHLRRIGRFSLAREWIEDRPEMCREALMDCIVVRAEQMFHTNAIQYDAMHPAFDVVPLGETIPWYHALVTRVNDEDHITWVRQSSASTNSASSLKV